MKRISILILALAMTGCAATAERDKPSTLDTYGLAQDELWELATIVMTNYGFQITQFNKEAGFIGAHRAPLGSVLEKMMLNIKCNNADGHCRAVVLSKPPMPFRWNYNSDPRIVGKMLEILEAR